MGVAMDLPIDDETAGAAEYAAVAVATLARVLDPVVIVGHSLGGVAVPLIAESRPTSRMVFISAVLPSPGKSLDEQRLEEPEMLFPYVGENNGLNKDRFYNACSPEDAEWAFHQLRYQSRRPFQEITPLEKWPLVPSSYIVCTEDHAVNPAWGRQVARHRLGTDAIELIGSDHSPMLNRPAELARLLVDLSGERGRDVVVSGQN